ncbi:nuclear transport factor 2 family protein [Streptomyces sp. NPDC050095]|uniref:nuclear transport factor 2 family protein n=1 Tax=unclassified Streptomyces TaxID=2593676 RepID=UPI00341B12B6
MTVELVSAAERALRSNEFAALYAQVQQFYAHQMRILDAHDTALWADTFTEDGLLELPSLPGPLPAREALARHVRAGAVRQRQAGGRLDHWVGLLDVKPRTDGSLLTRCSALAYCTPVGGGAKVLYVYVMQDVLVPDRGAWRTAHRRVTRDDLA